MKKLNAIFSAVYFSGVRPLRIAAVICALAIASSLSLLTFRVRVPVSAPIGWEKEFSVSPLRIKVANYSASSRGNFAVVAFEGEENGLRTISASVSVSGGKYFFSPRTIAQYSVSPEKYAPMNPKVAISAKGDVFLAWQGYSEEDFSYKIFYSYSQDFGATYSAAQKLSFETEMDFIPQIFYDDRGTLHIIYHSYSSGQFNLFQALSQKGVSFSKSEKIVSLSKDFRGAFFPAVESDGGSIFVMWQGKSSGGGALNDDLYFISSSNYGKSWSDYRNVTLSKGNDSTPYLKFFKGSLYCFYQNNDAGNWKINMIRSDDGGGNFSLPQIVSDTNANCYYPSASASGDSLAVFFYDAREKINNISAVEYDPSANKFGKYQRISSGKAPSRYPHAMSFGNSVLCLWETSGRIAGKFSDTGVNPPVASSKTHPDGKWSTLADAVVSWTAPPDESGIDGYAVIVNGERYFNPTVVNVGPGINSYRIPFLADGVTYFHIRAVDKKGNFSRTVSYPLMVSRSPLSLPDVESPTHPQGRAVESSSPLFKWTVKELERVKGYYYSLSKDVPSQPKIFTDKNDTSFAMLQNGRYFFSVRGVDKAGIPGRISRYEIVVGSAAELDPSVYRTMDIGEPKTVVAKRSRPIRIEPPKFDLTTALESGIPSVSVALSSPVSAQYFYRGFLLKESSVVSDYFSQDGRFEIGRIPDGNYVFKVEMFSDNNMKNLLASRSVNLGISGEKQAAGFDFAGFKVSSFAFAFDSSRRIAAPLFVGFMISMIFVFGIRRRTVFVIRGAVFSFKNRVRFAYSRLVL